MPNGTWSFPYTKARDLSDILSTVIKEQPYFIKAFPRKRSTVAIKHEWLEDVLAPTSTAFTSYSTTGTGSSLKGVFAGCNIAGFAVGDIVRRLGDPALYKISAASGTSITVTFVSSNGSEIADLSAVPTTAGTLIFDHSPVLQGSSSGTSLFSVSEVEYNYTEILRGDVELTNTALAIRAYGNENQMPYQLKRALIAITRQMNNIALFGSRTTSDPTSSNPSRCGGLYFFGTQSGGLGIDASSAACSLKLLNDAAQSILDAGGNPDTILCGPGQARVISQLMRSQIHIDPNDSTRGVYANKVVSESTGQLMNVFIEPSLSGLDTDVWVLDSSSLGLVYLRGRQIHSEPATAPGYDGLKFSIIGEFTLEFKNAKQKLCRISGLQSSAASLS